MEEKCFNRGKSGGDVGGLKLLELVLRLCNWNMAVVQQFTHSVRFTSRWYIYLSDEIGLFIHI